MTIPNVGVTGVIQDPGLGGSLAKGISGISQMLMLQQQLQAQEAKDKAEREYRQGILAGQEADRKAKADQAAATQRGQQQTGKAISGMLRPEQTLTADIPLGIGDASLPTEIRTGPDNLQKALEGMDPQFRAQFLQEAKPVIEQQQAQMAEKAKQEAVNRTIAQMPATLQPAMRAAVSAGMMGLPAAVVSKLYETIAGQLDEATLMSLKQQFPLLAELPQAEMLARIAEMKVLQTQRDLQLGPEHDRIIGRQIQMAQLGIQRSRLQMDKDSKDPTKEMNARQAALDIIKQVNDLLANDYNLFGKPIKERVVGILGPSYAESWQKAQDFLVGQGLNIPKPVPTGGTATRPDTAPPITVPNILQTPR